MSRRSYRELREGLEKNESSYFVKYNGVYGVAVSPHSKVTISKKNDSCFDANYRWEAIRRLDHLFIFE